MAAIVSKTARVVVIGAGAAGIAAATRLLEAGFQNVLVLEAEDRIGGRIYTVPFADNVVDLGAQWCHGEKNNAVFEMVEGLDVLESTGSAYEDYKCVRSNGELVPEHLSRQLKSLAFNSVPHGHGNLRDYKNSLGAHLSAQYWRGVKNLPDVNRTIAQEFFENFKRLQCSLEGSDDLFEVSLRGQQEYRVCEGDPLLNWKNKGFQTLLRRLMKSKSDGPGDLGLLNERVLLLHSVKQIIWDGTERIRIKCENGEVVEADHVICTMSLGVLKESHATMFRPALPAFKCRSIDGLSLGTVNKFFMEFDEPFGPLNWLGFCFLWLEEDLTNLRSSELFWLESVFGFFRVPHQPKVLEGWIIGPHGRHMETLNEEAVLEGLLWLFEKFFTFSVPQPINFIRTRWYSNRNFRGSYTFRSLYTDELGTGPRDLAEPLLDSSGIPRLQFAGEATSRHYYSTVHGAVESGWREAQRLVAASQRLRSQL